MGLDISYAFVSKVYITTVILVFTMTLCKFAVDFTLIKMFYLSNRTAEIMFEKYQVPALFLAKNAVSSYF